MFPVVSVAGAPTSGVHPSPTAVPARWAQVGGRDHQGSLDTHRGGGMSERAADGMGDPTAASRLLGGDLGPQVPACIQIDTHSIRRNQEVPLYM